MTPLLFLGLAVAGGLGAASRMLLDGIIKARVTSAFPWGTFVINVSGSLLLGFLTGLVSALVLGSGAQIVLGTGFLGGYTTFSTASYETVRLVQACRWRLSLVNAFGTLVTSLLAAALGLWLGYLL